MTVIKAKKIKWEESKFESNPGYSEFYDDAYGFHITEDPGKNPDDRFYAAWGEGDGEHFETLELAKEWCQQEIDTWIGTHAIVVLDQNA